MHIHCCQAEAPIKVLEALDSILQELVCFAIH